MSRLLLSVWLVLLTTAAAVGCGSAHPVSGGEPAPVAADCTMLVRYDGRVYAGTGVVVGPGESAAWPELPGSGELSACDDMGEDARGAYFPDDAQQVSVVALPGAPEEDAVGYRATPDRDAPVVVVVDEALPASERDALLARLQPSSDEKPLVRAGVRALRQLVKVWASEGPAAASAYLVPSQRMDASAPELRGGRVTSYAIASRDPATGEPTLLVTLDLTFRGETFAWSPGLNDRFVTVHRVGDDVRLELATGP